MLVVVLLLLWVEFLLLSRFGKLLRELNFWSDHVFFCKKKLSVFLAMSTDNDETSRLLRGDADKQPQQSPFQIYINFVVCAGLIALVVIGSLCLSRDEDGTSG